MNEWQSAALEVTRKIVRRQKHLFLAENLLPKVIEKVGEPSDRRQFGVVVRALLSDSEMYVYDFAYAKTSNNSPKRRYARAADRDWREHWRRKHG